MSNNHSNLNVTDFFEFKKEQKKLVRLEIRSLLKRRENYKGLQVEQYPTEI
jgi:hypothetical protein